MQALVPYFFQTTDPRTDVFLFASVLKVPTPEEQAKANGTLTTDCQRLTSWPCRKGFLGKDEPIEIPVGNEERLKHMRMLATG